MTTNTNTMVGRRHDFEKMELLQMGPSYSSIVEDDHDDAIHIEEPQKEDDLKSTIASVAGNVLEWYDFAIYGYFSDILGRKFFPPAADESTAIIESFLVFGGAFIVRPIGGAFIGIIGDKFSRKRALELSIFLMAFPTFAMGCLPTFETWGWWSVVVLVFVRLLQGLSAGGQLMSSLVFVAEGHDRKWWGWYGSWAMTSANFGTFLGGLIGYGMRTFFSYDQLSNGNWRIPFLCGIFVSASGFYLKHNVKDHKKIASSGMELVTDESTHTTRQLSPLQMAFSKKLRGSLFSVTASVILWSGGFYVTFVWLVICMKDLVDPPVPNPFAVNATSLFLTMVCMFPFAGWWSDLKGRRTIMTAGACGMALFGPMAMKLVCMGSFWMALMAQMILGFFLCLYAGPMCAWLVESFPAETRLTSVALGYNSAMAIAGGLSPSLATWLLKTYGPMGAGYLISTFAVIALCGLYSAPKHDIYR